MTVVWTLLAVMFFALLIQKVWAVLSKLIPEFLWNWFKVGKLDLNDFGTLVLGLIVAFSLWLNAVDLVLAEMGLTIATGWVGVLFTGIILAGGSNLVYDIFVKPKFELIEPYEPPDEGAA